MMIYNILYKIMNSFKLIITTIAILLCLYIIYASYIYSENTPLKSINITGATEKVTQILYSELEFLLNYDIENIDILYLSQYLSSLPWIQKASIYKNLNGTLNIFIVEYNSYFLYQDPSDNFQLINTQNMVINNKINIPLDNLITISGTKEALKNSDKIKFIIYKDIALMNSIQKLIYHKYYWNILLKNNIEIQLSENSMEQTYDMFIKKNKIEKFTTNNNIKKIILTSENKIFVEYKN